MTFITVVEVVGVKPNGQTSNTGPVKSTKSAMSASGDGLLPVRQIKGIPEINLRAKGMISRISRVFPELEIAKNKSFGCKRPRSPCNPSSGCMNTETVPEEQKVTANFLAISPALPT